VIHPALVKIEGDVLTFDDSHPAWEAARQFRAKKIKASRPPRKLGYGDILHLLFIRKYHIQGCDECKKVINQMNTMTQDQAIEAKPAILAEIWERKGKLTGWKNLATRLPGVKHLALQELGKLYDEAIGQTK